MTTPRDDRGFVVSVEKSAMIRRSTRKPSLSELFMSYCSLAIFASKRTWLIKSQFKREAAGRVLLLLAGFGKKGKPARR